MIRIRRSEERGRFRNGWLDARFSFSFGSWRDPAYDGYSDLLVLNEDVVAPGGGFAEHGHDNVEVMSYPLAGTIEHRDTLGNVALMRPGDVHLMRAGSGIRHSEMNASATDPEHHLQWWIAPSSFGLKPAYSRIHLRVEDKRNRLRLIASPEDHPGAMQVAQDTRVFATVLDEGDLHYVPPPRRRTFIHVARGRLALNGQSLESGDNVFAEQESRISLKALQGASSEILLFDLR